MTRLVSWLAQRMLGLHPSGHVQGILVCSKYGYHRHLPLDLVKWYTD